VDPLFSDKLLNVECNVLPRSAREGEVDEDSDSGPRPPIPLPVLLDDAVEAAVPGGLMLNPVPASACDGGDRIFEAAERSDED
jgi:hypothetical protein